jgi:hypothetical protein
LIDLCHRRRRDTRQQTQENYHPESPLHGWPYLVRHDGRSARVGAKREDEPLAPGGREVLQSQK